MGTPTSYPAQLPQYLTNGQTWNITNKGVAGETMATMLANYSTNIAPLFDASATKNILVLEACTNDLDAGRTPAQCYADMTSYVTLAHATGFKILIWTMLSNVNIETQRQALNTFIIGNTAGADGIINYNSTVLGAVNGYTSTTWFQSDKVHPTFNGVSSIEAPVAAIVINAQ